MIEKGKAQRDISRFLVSTESLNLSASWAREIIREYLNSIFIIMPSHKGMTAQCKTCRFSRQCSMRGMIIFWWFAPGLIWGSSSAASTKNKKNHNNNTPSASLWNSQAGGRAILNLERCSAEGDSLSKWSQKQHFILFGGLFRLPAHAAELK